MYTTSSMNDILEHVQALHNDGLNPILILDIDDTVLSSTFAKELVDKNVLPLIRFIDNISFDNLWFLTARDGDHATKQITQHHLNHAKLLHKGQYIRYNVMHSPHDSDDNPTKGDTLVNSLIPRIEIDHSADKVRNNYFVIVDDDYGQVCNMLDHLNLGIWPYTMFHFTT